MDRKGNFQSFQCPVCGGLLQKQLPDEEGVFRELFWFTEHIRFLTGGILLEFDFDHARDEEDEDSPLDVPHPLVASIRAVYEKGVCITFGIQEVRLRV